MNDALEVALNSFRFWRDRSNELLIAALVAEFLIEALWTDHLEWAPWTQTRIWQRWRWLKPINISHKRAMILAVGFVLAGVVGERFWGTIADDKSDQIRTTQQTRIADATAELSALIRLASGVREVTENDDLSKLRPYPASFWVQVIGEPPFGFRANEDVEKAVKAEMEANSFAISLTLLYRAGWQMHVVPDRLFNGPNINGVHVLTWTKLEYGNRFGRPPSGTPEAKAWDSAEAFVSFLHSELNLWTAEHETVTVLSEYRSLPRDAVYVGIGANHPDEEIRGRYDAERKAEEAAKTREIFRKFEERKKSK